MSREGRIAGVIAAAVARVLLLLYPREFRRDVGPDIAEDLRVGAKDRATSVGPVDVGVWILRNAAALPSGALREWRRQAGAAREVGDWAREVRQAARSLLRDRVFSTTVVVTLTLGIGMATAIFSVVDGVLLRPLAYPEVDDVVMIWQSDVAQGIERDPVAVGNYLDWRDRTTAFDGIAALEPWGVDFLTESGAEEIGAWRVTEDFFRVTRTPPLLGRTFTHEDFELQATSVVVSHGFWQERLGADPEIVGTTIQLDDAPVEVAGVMPPEFDLPRDNSVWLPRRFSEAERRDRVANYYQVVARLAPGVTLAAAQAELDRAATQVAVEFPRTNEKVGATVVPLRDSVLGSVRATLLILLASSGLLLIIACTNVASLVIARTNERLSQMGMRAAMGASRRDLVLTQVLECTLLALVAGVASALLVTWTLEGIKGLAPTTLPRISQVSVDVRVWTFALLGAFAVSVLVSLPASSRASKVDLTELLKGNGRRTTSARGARARRETLVAVQLAFALVLVTGATLVGRSVSAITALDPGYQTDNVAIVTSQIWRQYPSGPAQSTFVEESLRRLRATPGVRAVGTTSSLPLGKRTFADQASFFVERSGTPVEGRESSAGAAVVTPGYFEALGIPLISGRMFSSSDGPDAALVVVVNEELARRHWGGESPIGDRIRVSFAGPLTTAEVVGVVGDVRHKALDLDPGPRLYLHHLQKPNGAIVFTARTAVEPATLVESIKQELWAVNSSLAMGDSFALRELRTDAERQRRFSGLLLLVFAIAAVSIAAVGLYGLGAYAVARQRPEIGIRLALGATPRRIAGLFLARTGKLLVFGLGLGLVVALALTRFVRGLLYNISPTDPATLGLSILVLGVISLLATYIPARRASRTDPTISLRTD